MKIYKRHLAYLKILNLLSLIVILMTIFYSWYVLRLLPDVLQVTKSLAGMKVIVVDKSMIWEDIRLMVITYLIFSLITVFIELTPFRYSSGFHKAQIVSIINLCLSVVFAYTIISTICVAA